MKFLFVYTQNGIFDIAFALQSMGHTLVTMDETAVRSDTTAHQPYLDAVQNRLTSEHFDYVITYLYIPELSDICEQTHTLYIAWVYDSPLLSLFHPSIYNSCNRIFIFDNQFCSRLQQIGIGHVYHLPLAANVSRAKQMISSETVPDCAISFVGTLYEDNLYNEIHAKLPQSLLVSVNHYLMHELCSWHTPKQWPVLPEAVIDSLRSIHVRSDQLQTFDFPEEYYWGIQLLSRKLAEMDRVTALNTLAESQVVDLYTSSARPLIPNVHTHKPVDYYTTLPLIYKHSKINLNFTLPSIESGVPQRVFDILACGGFVLTNAQPELFDYFEVGKDLVVFHDLDELKELAGYYLSHDKKRQDIARHGYETLRDNYSYEKILKQVIYLCEESRKDF